jgi:hypothetical protein
MAENEFDNETDESGTEGGAVAVKERLSPEARTQAVRDARDKRIATFFEGRHFDYVEDVTLEGDDRYTDPSGNKGKSGHKIRLTSGDAPETPAAYEDGVWIVGPASLRRAAELNSITIPDGVSTGRARPRKAKVESEDTAD